MTSAPPLPRPSFRDPWIQRLWDDPQFQHLWRRYMHAQEQQRLDLRRHQRSPRHHHAVVSYWKSRVRAMMRAARLRHLAEGGR